LQDSSEYGNIDRKRRQEKKEESIMGRQSGEMVLLYNIEEKQIQKKYQMLCLRLGIRVKMVAKEQFLEPVGALSGAREVPLKNEVYEGEGFTDPMMVLKIYSNQKLDQLLTGIRKEGIPKIDYKAVLTEYNKEWNSLQLYEELKKEHEYMTGQRTKEENEKK
jgi:hypothetical protein